MKFFALICQCEQGDVCSCQLIHHSEKNLVKFLEHEINIGRHESFPQIN
jgi:hypothetical protein